MKKRLEILIKKQPAVSLFFLAWTLFFFLLWRGILVEKVDGLYAGHPYVWADWSMHTGLVSSFAYRPMSQWFSSHPFYAGAPLNYPFVTNLISGMLLRFGFSLSQAMIVPSFVFSLFLIAGLVQFYRRFIPSLKACTIAMLLFLCSGGLGFTFAKTLSDPTVVLTKIPEKGIEFTNIVVGMIVPQRAFLLGLPVGLFLLASIIAFTQNKKVSMQKLIGMGIVAGLLPLIHTHTYIAVVVFCAVVFLIQRTHIQKWLVFGGVSAGVSLLVYMLFLRTSVHAENFFSWQPGWYVHSGVVDWMLFWIKNWGVFLLLALSGTYLVYKRKPSEFVYVFAWWVLFLLANLIQFQPQTWDNSKLLAWAYLGLAVPAVVSLQVLWQHKNYLLQGLAPILFGVAVLSGSIDLLHMLDFPRQTFRMVSQDERILGQWVRSNTAPDAIFITPELVSNPIPMESGRSVFMGYSGWVFSYGFPYVERQQKLSAIYAGSLQATDVLTRSSSPSYLFIPSSETKTMLLYTSNIVFENAAGRIVSLTK